MRIFTGWVLLALATIAFANDNTRFIHKQEYVEGQAIIRPTNNGEYVYQEAISDGRDVKGPRYHIGKPARHDYRLFSAIEEAALWSLQDKLETKQRETGEAHFRARKPHVPALIWPKVAVVEGRGVCVPSRAYQTRADWLANAICFDKGDGRVN